jgi:amino acid adenylation domain-containing protein
MEHLFPLSHIELPIPHRFEATAREFPERIAVRARGTSVTYRQIDDWANAIAHTIVEAGGAPGNVIAVMLAKDDPAAIAALFGVLKAGRIYIALDPTSAPDYNRCIVKSCTPAILLTDAGHAANAEAIGQDGCPTIQVDQFSQCTTSSAPPVKIEPQSPALLIYTSGSTGQPKGVLWNHRNLLYSLRIMTLTMDMNPDDRVALLANMTVLPGPRDALSALLNGATLTLYDLRVGGIGELRTWIRSEAVTYINMVATVFRHFVSTLTPVDRFPSMRILRCSAEKLSREDLDAFNRHFEKNCRLRVGFAITETGNISQALIDHNTALPQGVMLGGHLLEDMEVVITDEDGACLPVGVVGNLAVRSRFLADGYWSDPALTAQVFLADPDGGDRRIYLTGDLARMRSDGVLEYHGRSDRMVKVRANKVFLDVVEQAMLDVEGVKQAAAIAWKDPLGNTCVVGYVSWSQPPLNGTQFLRSKLSARLPSPSVPSIILELPSLPATPQGKLDRCRLPEPDWHTRANMGEFIVPRTPVERTIANIWCEVLGLHAVSMTDRFLDLGGDSLKAGRIVARIRSAFGVQVPLRTLLEAATVADMAVSVTSAMLDRIDSEPDKRKED